MVKAFIDSPVVLHLFADGEKATLAESLFATEPVINIQVLNEVCNVLRRKSKLTWRNTVQALDTIRSVCRVEAMTVAVHQESLRLAQRYALSVYDAMIVAAALIADCSVLYSEGMQHDLHVDRRLRIINPFRSAALR